MARSTQVTVATPASAAASVADEIAMLVARCARERRTATLAIATGRTPLLLYEALAHRAREGAFAQADIAIFPLDELAGIRAEDPRSLRTFLLERLVRPMRLAEHCLRRIDDVVGYEHAIAECGGLDMVVLGIGRNGHIAYNEPGSSRDSRTREVVLAETSREDAADAFGSLDRVPTRGVTMGIATILDTRTIRLLAFGASKRDAVKRMWNEPVSAELPASFLREHPDFAMYVDTAAAA